MKNRLLLLTLGLALAIIPGVRAEDAKPAAKAEKPETELEKTMGKIGKAWRTVRNQSRDGKLSPATAQIVAGIRAGAEAATKLTPELEAEQPADKRAKFQADYVAQMKKFTGQLTDLETALKAGKNDEAKALIAEIGKTMKSGHQEFKKPDEKN